MKPLRIQCILENRWSAVRHVAPILSEGDPYQVQAHCCRCNKTWTLRGVLQITNLPREKGKEQWVK